MKLTINIYSSYSVLKFLCDRLLRPFIDSTLTVNRLFESVSGPMWPYMTQLFVEAVTIDSPSLCFFTLALSADLHSK